VVRFASQRYLSFRLKEGKAEQDYFNSMVELFDALSVARRPLKIKIELSTS